MDILSDLDFKNTSRAKNLPAPIDEGDGVPKSFLRNQKHKRQILTRSVGVGDSEANAIQLDSIQEEVTYFVDCFGGDVFLRLPSAGVSFSGENFPIRVQKIGFDYNRIIILAQPFQQILHPSINATRNDLKISQPGDFVQMLAVDPETYYCVDYDRSVQNVLNSDWNDGSSYDLTAEEPLEFYLNPSYEYNQDTQSAIVTLATTSFGNRRVFRPKVAGWYRIHLKATLFPVGGDLSNFRFYTYKNNSEYSRSGWGFGDIRITSNDKQEMYLNGTTDVLLVTAEATGAGGTVNIRGERGIRGITIDLIRKTYDN